MIQNYPIEPNDPRGINEAVNYLLSGPQGLGQNFDGFTSFTAGLIRPTFRQPFMLPENTTLDAEWYLSLPITNITPVTNPGSDITVDFTAAYVNPPFQYGDRLTITGTVDDESGLLSQEFNQTNAYTFSGTAAAQSQTTYTNILPTTLTGVGSGANLDITIATNAGVAYSSANVDILTFSSVAGMGYQPGDTLLVTGDQLGGATPANDLTLTIVAVRGYFNDTYRVVACTNTSVTLQYPAVGPAESIIWPNYISGGDLIRDYTNVRVSTDCNAKVNVLGPSDKVFISAQADLFFDFNPTVAGEFDIVFQINRYKGNLKNNADVVGTTLDLYEFAYDGTVSEKIYHYNTATTTSPQRVEAIFTTVIDGPNLPFGYYWYILEVAFVTKPTTGLSGIGTGTGGVVDDGYTASGFMEQSNVFGQIFPAVNATGGSGVGAVFNVTVYPDITLPDYISGNTVIVTCTTPGTGYKIGDVLTISGADLGGTTPLNDLFLTLTAIEYPGITDAGVFTVGVRSLTVQVIKQ